MKKLLLVAAAALVSTSALAQWQTPVNTVPFGRGSGTGFNFAAAAANSVLMTDGAMLPGFGQTLPTAVQNNITRVGTLTAGAIPTTLFTGTLQCAQFPALTGDLTTIANACATTLATVNSNIGAFGSATQCVTITVNAKGLITAASQTTCAPLATSIASPAALTKTDDTNITLALGGTPATALLRATSLTLGWTGTLATSRGGLGGAPTPTTAKGLKGNGTAWITTTTDVAGSGACGGGQFVTAVNGDAAPTCGTPAGGGTVTSVQLSNGNGINVSVTAGANPITTTGNLTITNTGVVSVVIQQFTATGTYTPTTGMIYANAECVGGGGGGGSVANQTGTNSGAGGGGGAGSYCRSRLTAAAIGASKTVTIGASGAGGTAPGGSGGNGGQSCIGGAACSAIILSTNGGTGGTSGINGGGSAGGAGGAVGTGDVCVAGQNGGYGIGGTINTINYMGGIGGSSFFGGAGGQVSVNGQIAGVAGAANSGSGGSGAVSNSAGVSVAGGAGAAGRCVITEFVSQ